MKAAQESMHMSCFKVMTPDRLETLRLTWSYESISKSGYLVLISSHNEVYTL